MAGLEAQIGPATMTDGERDMMVQSDYMLEHANEPLEQAALGNMGRGSWHRFRSIMPLPFNPGRNW